MDLSISSMDSVKPDAERLVSWDQARRERRMKLIPVSVDDVEAYCITRFGEPFSENFVDTYDLPEEWRSYWVHYDAERDAFMFLACSPEFDPVELGAHIPLVQATTHPVLLVRTLMD